MINLRYFFMFLATLAVHGFAGAENPMQSAWQQVLAEHQGFSANAAKLSAAEAQIAVAQSRYLPALNLQGRWNFLDEEVGIWFDTGALMPGGKPIYIPVQEKQYGQLQLQASWAVYTGGKITAGVQARQAEFDQQQAKNVQAENDLFERFVERYLRVNLAAENARIRKLALDNFAQHLHRAKRQFEEGTLAYTSQLQAQVEHDKAQREWRNAELDYQLAQTAYLNLFANGTHLPQQPLNYQSAEKIKTASQQSESLAQHAGLKQLSASKRQLNAALDSVRAEYLPTIALFAQRELIPDDLTELDPEWAAGVQLQWQLFGGESRAQRQLHYQALQSSVELAQQQALKDLNLLRAQRLSAIDHAEESYRALTSSLALAEENLRLRRAAVEQGLATPLDEIDAQLLLTGLQLEQQKSLFDYYFACAQLAAMTNQQQAFFNLFASVLYMESESH